MKVQLQGVIFIILIPQDRDEKENKQMSHDSQVEVRENVCSHPHM